MSAAHDRIADKHWVVKVGVSGTVIYLASLTEPKVILESGHLSRIDMTLPDDPSTTDVIGYLDMSAVTSVSWRLHLAKDRTNSPRNEPDR